MSTASDPWADLAKIAQEQKQKCQLLADQEAQKREEDAIAAIGTALRTRVLPGRAKIVVTGAWPQNVVAKLLMDRVLLEALDVHLTCNCGNLILQSIGISGTVVTQVQCKNCRESD